MNTRIPLEQIENQLKKVFDSSGSKWVRVSFILSRLDIPINLELKRAFFSSDLFMRLYLYKRIKGISTYPNLIKELDKEDLRNLGLTDGVPKKRTFNEFIQKNLAKEDTALLDTIAEKILSFATKNNIILDIELVKKTITKKKKEISNKNKAFKESVKLVKKLVYPQIEIKMRHNAKFTTKDLLDILVHLAHSHDFCTNGVRTFAELNPEMNLPARETVMYHFRKFNNKEDIEETFRKIFDVIFEFSKKNYNLLSRRKLDIGIDVHDVCYYGSKADPFVIGGKHYRGTSYFFKFITCSILVSGKRFCIDALLMNKFEDLDYYVDKLIKRAKQKIRIDRVFLDRGFDRSEVIRVLKKSNVKYLMPKVRTQTTKQWFDKSEDCESRVIKDFKIKDVTTNLVIVNDEKGIKRAFSTNLNIPPQVSHYLFKFYSTRWGIETKYRQLEVDFKARTTSKNFHIRLFYFLFSTCLFNLWVLINICVSIKIYGRLIEKPIISSKLFALVLCKVQVDTG